MPCSTVRPTAVPYDNALQSEYREGKQSNVLYRNMPYRAVVYGVMLYCTLVIRWRGLEGSPEEESE